MNIAHRHTAVVSFVVLCCWAACLGSTAVAAQPQATQLSAEEQKGYELVQKRHRNHEDLLSGAGFTLVHCADPKEVKRVVEIERLLTDRRQIPTLVEAGGLRPCKDNVALLLKSKDPVVRGYGAILLAVIGDAGYKSNIATLLKDKPGPPPAEDDISGRLSYNWDRSRAAMALGLMGAKEYAPRLAALLRSSDYQDRAGAALGLGYMGAKEHVKDIAPLLSDDEDGVQTSAMEALAELGAADYAKDIAGFLTSLGDTSVNETACYALVRLNAKEQAKELAALLDDKSRQGDAAKALALLGAKEYTKDIAALTEDSHSLVRNDALIALGILDAKEYVKNIATHLRDETSYVRAYAAVALLLMGDQTYSRDIVEVTLTQWKGLGGEAAGVDITRYFSGRITLPPVVAESQKRLVTRAVQEWQRMNRSENGLQQNGAANASQPIRTGTNRTPSAAGDLR